MGTPLLTVGIPFHNNEKTLLDAIRSIFSQTFQDWELILVDDGSTDDSLKLALSVEDPRVRVLPSDDQNRLLAARLNEITQAARGEFIARMDADDLHRDMGSNARQRMVSNFTVDLIANKYAKLFEIILAGARDARNIQQRLDECNLEVCKKNG